MGVYGPYTAVAGTLHQCAINPDAALLYVRNVSRFDLAISLQDAQPFATTNFGGQPWDVVVPSGDRVGVSLALGRYPSGFSGNVWVLPVDNSGSLAISGTKSGNSQFYLEGYSNAAIAPADYASAQFANLASQPRVITIPSVPHILGVNDLEEENLFTSNTFYSWASLTTWTGDGVTAHSVTGYLYDFHLTQRGLRWGNLQWSLAVMDNSSDLVVSRVLLATFDLFSGVPYAPPQAAPRAAVISGTGSNGHLMAIVLLLELVNSWPAASSSFPLRVFGSASVDVDLSAQTPPPGIGNGSATIPGTIY